MKTIKELTKWCVTNSVRVSIVPGMVDAQSSVKFQFDDMVTDKRFVMGALTDEIEGEGYHFDPVEYIVQAAERNLGLKERRYREGQGREKLIVVHRDRMVESADDSSWVIGTLIEKFGADAVKLSRNDRVVDVFGIRIEFRAGDVRRCAGLRPDYYIVSGWFNEEFLEQSAAKVNGKHLQSLEDVIKVVEDHYSEVKKDADSKRG